MIVGDEEARVADGAEVFGNPFLVVDRRFDQVVLAVNRVLFRPFLRLSGKGGVVFEETRHIEVVLRLRDHIEMIHGHKERRVAAEILLDRDLVAVECDEFVVAKLLVSDQHLVVGVADRAVAVRLEMRLDLLGGLCTVRNRRVAVKVCLIEASAFGNEFKFHK